METWTRISATTIKFISKKGTSTRTPKQRAIFDAYNATGRIAFYYPRKGMISINGGRRKPVKVAIEEMEMFLLDNTKSESTHEECTKGMFDAMEPTCF